jgi:hypothetical protein
MGCVWSCEPQKAKYPLIAHERCGSASEKRQISADYTDYADFGAGLNIAGQAKMRFRGTAFFWKTMERNLAFEAMP